MNDYYLAMDSNTPPEILDNLANDEYFYTRCQVAKNPTTSTETLEHLANDLNNHVRSLVASNPNTLGLF